MKEIKFEVSHNGETYGILQDKELEVVPYLHKTKNGAIKELIAFLKLNLKKSFLPFTVSLEEIDRIERDLVTTNHCKLVVDKNYPDLNMFITSPFFSKMAEC